MRKSGNEILICILIVGFVLRIGSAAFLAKYEDADGYLTFARSIYNTGSYGYDEIYYEQNKYADIGNLFEANPNPVIKKNGHSVVLTSHYAIGWPLQIYMIYRLTGGIHPNAVLIYLVIISTLSILLFYLIALELFNRQVALICTIIAVLNPIYIIDTSTFANETSFLFFFLCSLYFFQRLLKNQGIKEIVLWSVFIALATLIRPIAFLHFCVLAFALLLFRKFDFKFLFIPVFFLLILSPWIIRNYNAFHRFIPFTTISGTVFFQGNNPFIFEEKSGSYSRQDALWQYENKVFSPGDDNIEVSKIARHDGIQFIKSLSLKNLILHEWYKLRLGFGLSPAYILKRPEVVNRNIKYAFNNNTHPYTLKNNLIYYPLFFLTAFFFLFYLNKAKRHFENFNSFLIIIFSGILAYTCQTLIYFAFMRYRAYLLDTFLIFSAALFIYFIPAIYTFMNRVIHS
jgi:4-amino-4-deoxy-L-arabinose transferase-like glycosyltransferase